MNRQIATAIFLTALMVVFSPLQQAEASSHPDFESLMDTAFETNSLEMAVLILVNDNNIPVSDVIAKARKLGFAFTRIVDALIDTSLSCEQVMIQALLNGVPPAALFDSKVVSDENGYTPELLLEFLVRELRFMERNEEEIGQEDYNLETRRTNLEVILRVCKSMMDERNISQFDVMTHLCKADAGNELIAEFMKRFEVPPATAYKACPEHARYGHAYISRDLPHKAYIVIGVDHLTIDDNAARNNGVISPKRP